VSVVLLLSATLGLLVFTWLQTWPRFSPRMAMVRRLGVTAEPPPAVARGAGAALARRLRLVALTRHTEPMQFRLLQAGLAAGAALLLTGPWWVTGGTPDWIALAVYPPLCWLLPEAWLVLQLWRRRTLIARGYLDLLSHLALQTRAGVPLPEAFASSWPVLTDPLKGEVAELAYDLALMAFPEALARFAGHCDTPEIQDFVQNVLALPATDTAAATAGLLAAECSHALARAHAAVHRQRRIAAPVMAAAAVLLASGGTILYFLPLWFR
jgi:hypothetical protein